jgi:predicted YcjX-like family ATPase
MKELLIFIAGAAIGMYFSNAEAQTYAVQNAQGYVQGYIQQNGNTVNVLTPNGNTVGQPLTVYPTQLTTPAGGAIGYPSYSVPPSPPSPPSPRVLQ